MRDDPNVKLCECGCLQAAPIAAQTYARFGHVRGKPMRFVRGHHPGGRHWSPQEDEALRRLRSTRMTNAEIAAAVGRTLSATSSRMDKMRMSETDPRPPRGGKLPAWTDTETDVLREAVEAGESNIEIARRLGRSKQAINMRVFVLGLAGRARRRSDPTERFWAKVNKTDGCWLWTGTIFWNGYGCFGYERRSVKAHRFAYELLVGPIPNGASLRHSCDTPACVNPEHLIPGTHAENMGDMEARGRRAQNYAYSADEIERVRELLSSRLSQTEVSRRTGVHLSTVHRVAAGRAGTRK